MKRDDLAKLRGLSIPELNARARETKEELFNLRFQQRTGALLDLSRLRTLRRTYATIQNLINEKQRSQHGAA